VVASSDVSGGNFGDARNALFDVSGLRSAGSLSELQADVATIRTEFQTLSSNLADDLGCS